MIDRSKTIAKSYVSEWYKQNVFKSSTGHSLVSKVQNNEFATLDAFVLYVVVKYKVEYANFPAEFKQDVSFLIYAINKVEDPFMLLASIAKSNKATYARVLETLNEKVLAKLAGMDEEKLSRSKAVSKVRKLVNERIAEEKAQTV